MLVKFLVSSSILDPNFLKYTIQTLLQCEFCIAYDRHFGFFSNTLPYPHLSFFYHGLTGDAATENVAYHVTNISTPHCFHRLATDITGCPISTDPYPTDEAGTLHGHGYLSNLHSAPLNIECILHFISL